MAMTSKMRGRPLARLRGVAAVEMALILIPLALLLTGVFNFGLAMYRYDSIVKGVRAASRYLSTQTPGTSYANAKALVICGNSDIAPGACPDADRIPGLTEGMISICDRTNAAACGGQPHTAVDFGTPPDNGRVDLVTVQVTGYPYTFSIPFTTLGTITFGPIRSTMLQGAL